MPDLTSTTVTTNVLKVKIELDNNKSITYNIQNPKTGLSKDDVENASKETGFAGYMVNENLIKNGSAMAVEVGDAYYYETQKIVFD